MTTYRFDPAKVAKLAKGDVAVEYTMKEEDLPMLRALLNEAFPISTKSVAGDMNFYVLDMRTPHSSEWYSPLKTYLRNIPLHSFLMEEEISCYTLSVKERSVVRAISGAINRSIPDHTDDLQINNPVELELLRKIGVLELWFKPIYKKREEPKEPNKPLPYECVKEIATGYIPLQKCPVCEGYGSIPDYSEQNTNITCDVCNGSKVIPMHKVKE